MKQIIFAVLICTFLGEAVQASSLVRDSDDDDNELVRDERQLPISPEQLLEQIAGLGGALGQLGLPLPGGRNKRLLDLSKVLGGGRRKRLVDLSKVLGGGRRKRLVDLGGLLGGVGQTVNGLAGGLLGGGGKRKREVDDDAEFM